MLLFGTLASTQALSTYGILTSINLLLWYWGVRVSFGLQALVFIMRYWQYESAWKRRTDTTYSNIYRAQYAVLLPLVGEDI